MYSLIEAARTILNEKMVLRNYEKGKVTREEPWWKRRISKGMNSFNGECHYLSEKEIENLRVIANWGKVRKYDVDRKGSVVI